MTNETCAVTRESVFFQPERTAVFGRVLGQLIADVFVCTVRGRKGKKD